MKDFIVAIDGPAGSGKSSISDIVSKKLGFTHVDTGAFFRAITLEALRRGINLENEDEYSFLDEINVIYKEGKTYLNDEDVSGLIRTPEISNNVSVPAKLKRVRERVIDFERLSSKGKIIMDGRDIGTVVLPNADLKIFLTASNEERARRRFEQNKLLGIESDYNTILKEIIERDKKDSERAIAPLKQAIDAIPIDTTKMSIDEVSNMIISLINERNE
jgi:cytidylate kinase